MALVPVYCKGPGPHERPDGVIAHMPEEDAAESLARGVPHRCPSPYCISSTPEGDPPPEVPPEEFTRFDNKLALRQQARAAYATNRALLTDAAVDAYLGAASPPPADTVKAVKLLLREARAGARQRNAIMRLLLEDLDGTD